MSREFKYNVVIAESSPVISLGISQCLRRLGNPQLNIYEANTNNELIEITGKNNIDIIIVNPTLGGVFNPLKLRNESLNSDIKIIAIEIGKLSKQASALYDETIHVTDDFETIKKKIKNLCSNKDIPSEEKDSLSTREKEIISLVVKGLTNQEIADKLFLSIHTVITHRRNIARKLEIHSATGLTIYAIVNKIVNIEDVVH